MSCNPRGIRNAARKPCAQVGGEKPAYYVADSAPTGMNAVGVAAAGFISLGGPVRKTGTASKGTAPIGKPAPLQGHRQSKSPLQRDKDGNLRDQIQVGGIKLDVDAHEGDLHVDYDAIAQLVARVRPQGHRCDSVNQVLPFILARLPQLGAEFHASN